METIMETLECGHAHNRLIDWGLAHNRLDNSILLACVTCEHTEWVIR